MTPSHRYSVVRTISSAALLMSGLVAGGVYMHFQDITPPCITDVSFNGHRDMKLVISDVTSCPNSQEKTLDHLAKQPYFPGVIADALQPTAKAIGTFTSNSGIARYHILSEDNQFSPREIPKGVYVGSLELSVTFPPDVDTLSLLISDRSGNNTRYGIDLIKKPARQ